MEQQNPEVHPLLHPSLAIARSSRDVPPAHYTLKIDSFSQLVQSLSDTRTENYESEIFEASGYKWKLSLYPNGDKEQNGEGHISLYLVIVDSESLPAGWEVRVKLKLFVYDKVHDTYSIFRDNKGKIRHFNQSKTELGFAKLLPLSVFKDPSNGFLTRDKCAFGVEVFVLNYSGKGECVTSQEKVEAIHTWKIDNFSSLQNECYSSDDITLANRTWEVKIYPKGSSKSKGKFLALCLTLNDTQTKEKAYVNYRLRVRDQLHGRHEEVTDKDWFTQSASGRVWSQFLTLSDLNNASRGFLIKDTLIVESADICNFFQFLNQLTWKSRGDYRYYFVGSFFEL